MARIRSLNSFSINSYAKYLLVYEFDDFPNRKEAFKFANKKLHQIKVAHRVLRQVIVRQDLKRLESNTHINSFRG